MTMLVRKLIVNFIKRGSLTSTSKRIRMLKPEIEILVGKAKRAQNSDKNLILSKLADLETRDLLINKIAPNFKDRIGGYVRIKRLVPRVSDGAPMARLEWVVPIDLKPDVKVEKEVEKKEKVKKVEKAKTKK